MKQLLEDLQRRLLNVIARGRVTQRDDSGAVQILQIRLRNGQVLELPRLGAYGLASNPPDGSDVLVVSIYGDGSNGVVVSTGHQDSRLRGLAVGESALYDDQGQKVHITRGGIVIEGTSLPININTSGEVKVNNADQITLQASVKVRMETPLLEVTGDIIDNVGAGNTHNLSQMRVIYNGHHHAVAGVQGGLSTILSNVPDALE